MSDWRDKPGRIRKRCGDCTVRVERTLPWHKRRVFRCDFVEHGVGLRVGKESRCYHSLGVQYESERPRRTEEGERSQER